MDAKQLDDLLAKAREMAKDPEFDSLTIKDLKLGLKPGAEEKHALRPVASIVTVVILIVDT